MPIQPLKRDESLSSPTAEREGEREGERQSSRSEGRAAPRPAVLVQPFVAMGEESSLRAQAAALTEQVESLMARGCWFSVVGAAAAGEARYVIRATLQSGDGRWRVSARLEDALSSALLWSERYDVVARDAFAAQDCLSENIVASACEALVREVTSRTRTDDEKGPFWLAIEGMRLHATRDVARNAEAQSLFREAIQGEPTLALAHYGLGLCQYDAVLNQLDDASADGLLASAHRCIDLAPGSAEGYYLLGRHCQVRGRHAEAVAPLEDAIARNPSFAPAYALLAQVLVLSGRADEGLARMHRAQELAPRSFVAGLATLHFLREEYDLALERCVAVLAVHPTYPFVLALAAASAYWLGRRSEAERYVRALEEQRPGYSPVKFLLTFGAGFAGVDRIARALAGLGVAR